MSGGASGSSLPAVLQRLPGLGGLSARQLTRDTHGLFAREALFGLVCGADVYFHAGHETVTKYLVRGTRPYRTGGMPWLRGYWSAPPEVLEDPQALLDRALLAADACRLGKRSCRPPPRRPTRRATARKNKFFFDPPSPSHASSPPRQEPAPPGP